jgi:hypothetical protein
MTVTWTTTPSCTLKTEVGTTKEFGRVGYIREYLNGYWASVYIYENGVESDSYFKTNGEAKNSVVEELTADIADGRW